MRNAFSSLISGSLRAFVALASLNSLKVCLYVCSCERSVTITSRNLTLKKISRPLIKLWRNCKRATSVTRSYKSFGGVPMYRYTLTFRDRKIKSANPNITEIREVPTSMFIK